MRSYIEDSDGEDEDNDDGTDDNDDVIIPVLNISEAYSTVLSFQRLQEDELTPITIDDLLARSRKSSSRDLRQQSLEDFVFN